MIPDNPSPYFPNATVTAWDFVAVKNGVRAELAAMRQYRQIPVSLRWQRIRDATEFYWDFAEIPLARQQWLSLLNPALRPLVQEINRRQAAGEDMHYSMHIYRESPGAIEQLQRQLDEFRSGQPHRKTVDQGGSRVIR